MANTFQQDRTTNLLIPANGATKTVTVQLPGASGFVVDMNQYIIDDAPFSPQAVTVDASDVPVGETVLFTLARLGWRRIVQGGQIETFTVPGISNWSATVAPSDGISAVRLYLYNYPAFPDSSGAANNSVTLSGPVSIAGVALKGASVGSAASASTYDLVAASVGQSIELHALSYDNNNNGGSPVTFAVVASSLLTIANAFTVFSAVTGGASVGNSRSLTLNTPILLPAGDSLQVIQSAVTAANSSYISAVYRYI